MLTTDYPVTANSQCRLYVNLRNWPFAEDAMHVTWSFICMSSHPNVPDGLENVWGFPIRD